MRPAFAPFLSFVCFAWCKGSTRWRHNFHQRLFSLQPVSGIVWLSVPHQHQLWMTSRSSSVLVSQDRNCKQHAFNCTYEYFKGFLIYGVTMPIMAMHLIGRSRRSVCRWYLYCMCLCVLACVVICQSSRSCQAGRTIPKTSMHV